MSFVFLGIISNLPVLVLLSCHIVLASLESSSFITRVNSQSLLPHAIDRSNGITSVEGGKSKVGTQWMVVADKVTTGVKRMIER